MRVHAPTAHVRVVAPPAVEATLTIAARGTGLKLVPCALRSLEHGEVTPDAVAPLESRARSPVPHLSVWTR